MLPSAGSADQMDYCPSPKCMVFPEAFGIYDETSSVKHRERIDTRTNVSPSSKAGKQTISPSTEFHAAEKTGFVLQRNLVRTAQAVHW